MDNGTFDINMELAKILLEHALTSENPNPNAGEPDRIRMFLLGEGDYNLMTMDPSGYQVPDTTAIMQSLYKLNNERKDLKIKERFDKVMRSLTRYRSNPENLDRTFRMIECYLQDQKDHRAGFTVDCDVYIENLKSLSQRIKSDFNIKAFTDVLDFHSWVLSKDFGKNIL